MDLPSPTGRAPAPKASIADTSIADAADPDATAPLDVGPLAEALDAILAPGRDLDMDARRAVLAAGKDWLGAAEAEIARRIEADEPAWEVMAARSEAIDGLIRTIMTFATRRAFPSANPTTGDRIAVAATGGYGRGELAPHSDIDLLFVLPYKQTPRVEQILEFAMYLLWDLGLKVGHATRSVDECVRLARQDLTIRTALLEMRFLWGETVPFEELRKAFWETVAAGTEADFVEAKLAERDERHRKLGDSRYVVEPNLKDGKGGLRDLHTLYWIAKYIFRVDQVSRLVSRGVFTRTEVRRFQKAERFLGTVRCHLHLLAGRPEERLTFDVQPELAARLGYTDRAGVRGVERFMKHYYLVAKDVGDLTRVFCAALESEHIRRPKFSLTRLLSREKRVAGFRIDGGRLDVLTDTAFRDDPVAMLRLFRVAQEHDLDVHPRALRLIRRDLKRIDAALRADADANRLFVEMLTSPKDPETTLRRLNEADVLGRFIPDFGRVVALMQYDMYHVYTVDEHTIRAIGILRSIEEGRLRDEVPVATRIAPDIHSRRALFVAMFCHDIAKGRGGDHSVLGAGVARRLGPRLGLDEAETETAAWLVRHHLAMSATAFKRDLADPLAIQQFTELVQSPERLRLLLLLTIADIRAVGPNVWNAWKASLLRELYDRADEVLTGGGGVPAQAARAAEARTALRAALDDWSDAEIEAHFAKGPDVYWTALDTGTLAQQARLLRRTEAMDRPLVIEIAPDPAQGTTEVTICTLDHPGLFSRIAGLLAVAGANIVDARAFTLLNGFVIDTFRVQGANGRPFENADRLRQRIVDGLAGKIDIVKELAKQPPWPSRTGVFRVPPRVLIDNKASRAFTVIEVNGRDRPGFLNRVTWALTKLGLQISFARIATYGERAIDVFYVKDVFGLKIEHETKLRQIREGLMEAISDGQTGPTPAQRKARKAPRRERRSRSA